MPVIGIGASLIGSVVGGIGASKAAAQQAKAAQAGIDFAKKNQQNSLDFQNQEWTGQQANEMPFLQAGQGAIGNLSSELSPGGSLYNVPSFQAPTDVTEQNDPGYQFRLAQGQKLLENSAAARGDILSGGTAKSLLDYGQQAASNEYGNVYQRALQNYQLGIQNQQNLFNRQSTLAGFGENAANALGEEGQAAAGNIAGINTNASNEVGNLLTQKGNAQAAGTVGVANAITGGLNSFGSLYYGNQPPNLIPGANDSWMLNNASSYGYK